MKGRCGQQNDWEVDFAYSRPEMLNKGSSTHS